MINVMLVSHSEHSQLSPAAVVKARAGCLLAGSLRIRWLFQSLIPEGRGVEMQGSLRGIRALKRHARSGWEGERASGNAAGRHH